jgi:hypothetical protein
MTPWPPRTIRLFNNFQMDCVFTVCDQAAGKACPAWPGNLVTAHWGMPDPAAIMGTKSEHCNAFRDTFRIFENRIRLFTSLPINKLDRIQPLVLALPLTQARLVSAGRFYRVALHRSVLAITGHDRPTDPDQCPAGFFCRSLPAVIGEGTAAAPSAPARRWHD